MRKGTAGGMVGGVSESPDQKKTNWWPIFAIVAGVLFLAWSWGIRYSAVGERFGIGLLGTGVLYFFAVRVLVRGRPDEAVGDDDPRFHGTVPASAQFDLAPGAEAAIEVSQPPALSEAPPAFAPFGDGDDEPTRVPMPAPAAVPPPAVAFTPPAAPPAPATPPVAAVAPAVVPPVVVPPAVVPPVAAAAPIAADAHVPFQDDDEPTMVPGAHPTFALFEDDEPTAMVQGDPLADDDPTMVPGAFRPGDFEDPTDPNA